jgi:3-deoxy-D-manno-octulosonic-acid transferase
MIWLLYNTVLTVLLPFWLHYAWWKSKRRAEQPDWTERQGNYALESGPDKRRVWVHTVSVGEFVAAKPILRELRKVLPDYEIVVSVTTSSGHRTAREAEEGLFDHLFYFPLDVARFQLAAMQRVQPDAVAIMETELWMNFLWAAKTFDAQTLLVNGRISDRSFPRSRKLKFFYRALLKDVDICLMQTPTDAERITELGAKDAEVFGNCKFDEATEPSRLSAVGWRKELGFSPDKPVVVIGSTRGEEEEAFVIEAIKAVGLDLVNVVHAPRHLERVPALAEKVAGSFGAVALRSKGETGPYLILDTYGELASIYSVADIVVIGGGFANLGGQNILQPLGHGKPVIHGPHMQNFKDVASAAEAAGASIAVDSPAMLAESIRQLLQDEPRRLAMGKAARELIEANVGASRRYAAAIAEEAKRARSIKDKRKRKAPQSNLSP